MILDEWQSGSTPGRNDYERCLAEFTAGPGVTLTVGGVTVLDPAWQIKVAETVQRVRFEQDIHVPNPDWKLTDQAGHRHVYRVNDTTGKHETPTLEPFEQHLECSGHTEAYHLTRAGLDLPPDLVCDGYEVTALRCRQCGETVTPRTISAGRKWQDVSTGWELAGRIRLSLPTYGRLSGAQIGDHGTMTWPAAGTAPRQDLALTAAVGAITVHVVASVGLDAYLKFTGAPPDLAEADPEVLMGDVWADVTLTGALTEPPRFLRATQG